MVSRRWISQFLSTPSARRATNIETSFYQGTQISIHALREEGDEHAAVQIRAATAISIHALREEGDLLAPQRDPPNRGISIHALREEGDLSTGQKTWASIRNFYPRPPRGGRLGNPSAVNNLQNQFLSTPSARRATPSLKFFVIVILISIHALREEGDVARVVSKP